jgi:hypothetical protein
MVIPFLTEALPGFLSGQSFYNWLRTDGSGLFTAFETGQAALDFLRELGSGIRTQEFYKIRREVLSLAEARDKLLGYVTNQLIPLNWHDQNHGLQLTTEFQYRIELFGADPETGTLSLKYMTIASNRQLTIDEVHEAARNYVGEGQPSGQIEQYVFGTITPMQR